MANVKFGKDIQTESDAQNVITALILRQQEKFTLEDIVSLYKQYSESAAFKTEDVQLKEKIDETLDIFWMNQIVTCVDGVYQISCHFPSVKGS